MGTLGEFVCPEMEPGVISKEMIEKSYLEAGYKGETLRLHQLEAICYENITVLRLEFLNILRIDHLWMMTNLTKLSLNCNKIEVIENIEMLTALKELNLSFNFIEKIENLDSLKNLEVLSLFNNLITDIEGFDALENLIIFSLGNNRIQTLKGIERIRFLKNLKVFNMEGNPVCNKLSYPLSIYIAAVLPNVKYYEYVYIEDDVRQAGREKFRREIRAIETAEEEEIELRNRKAKELDDELRLSSSFVEYLNEHQLYESLWEGDDDGSALIQIGGDAVDDLLAEYRKDIFSITQEIYNLGLDKFEERKNEIDFYTNGVKEGQLRAQESGHRAIDEYLIVKGEIFKKAQTCLKEWQSQRNQEIDNFTKELEKISSDFQDKTNDVWQILIGDELHLNESIMESTSFFERNMKEMMSKFVEQAETYFAQIRDVATNFSDHLKNLVQEYIGSKLASQTLDEIPERLSNCLNDKEAIMKLITGMKDHHIRKVDDREDRLVMRSNIFISDLIEGLHKEELDRNRAKILEIDSYLQEITNTFDQCRQHLKFFPPKSDVKTP